MNCRYTNATDNLCAFRDTQFLLPFPYLLAILEEGMRNLVKETDVTSTRSHYYTKPEKFADYILVSPDITVVDFNVLPDVISDHLSLVLEFR